MRVQALPSPVRNRLLVVALAALVVMVPAAPPAEAATPKEKKLVKLVNGYRTKKGKSTLKTAKKLTTLAHKHSKAMKESGTWFHSTNAQLLSYMKKANCKGSIGENVGALPGKVVEMHQGFIDSTPHRKQMLKWYWKKMGAGVVVDGSGWLWATELFCY
ncbi:MAG: CAP domain-containing protein [Actinomycetota bacterium]